MDTRSRIPFNRRSIDTRFRFPSKRNEIGQRANRGGKKRKKRKKEKSRRVYRKGTISAGISLCRRVTTVRRNSAGKSGLLLRRQLGFETGKRNLPAKFLPSFCPLKLFCSWKCDAIAARLFEYFAYHRGGARGNFFSKTEQEKSSGSSITAAIVFGYLGHARRNFRGRKFLFFLFPFSLSFSSRYRFSRLFKLIF